MYKFLVLFFIGVAQLCSAQTLDNIESVEYDPSHNRFFISNNTNIIQRAADGTLTQFGSGSATHGMEVMGDNLFVISGSAVRGYSLSTEEEVMSMNIPGAGFLNGMANDGVSKLWVTDFGNEKIFEIDVSDLENPTAIVVVNDTESTPNGIVYDYLMDRLLFVTWGSNAEVVRVDLDTYELTSLVVTEVGNIDGIDMNMQGEFFLSSWSPNRITKYNSDFTGSEILQIIGLNSPADISFADATDTLGIPNSGNNTVLFYSENVDVIEDIAFLEEKYQLKVVPNPVKETAKIEFVASEPTYVQIDLFDMQGRKARQVCNGLFLMGNHAIQLDGSSLESGVYSLHMKVNGVILKRQIIFE